MHAPLADLPILLEEVTLAAGRVTILDGISLRLDAGPPTVLLGPNGSGKSSLLRLAFGLVPPSSGRISWGGRSVAVPQRRAIMLQRPTMLRRTAAGNIRYALKAAGVPRAARAAQLAELLALVGLEALAERPARRMSGGEQQRLALARALARDPTVLFLDEPAAGLDPTATKSFEDVVRAVVARGIKLVMATHDLGQARRLAGEIVLLHRGRVLERAPAADFFAAPRTDEARRFIAGDLLV